MKVAKEGMVYFSSQFEGSIHHHREGMVTVARHLVTFCDLSQCSG